MRNLARLIKSIIKQRYYGNSICYHSVSPNAAELIHTHSVTFKSFKRHINLVSTARQFVPAVASEFDVVDNKVALTFDDAYLDILDEAIPYLIDKKIPATIFINSSTLSGSILWRDKLRLILNANLADEFCQTLPAEFSITPHNLYFNSKSPAVNSAVMSGFIDAFITKKGLGVARRLYMNAEELRQLDIEETITLGNHTRNHFVLSSLSQQQQQEEIIGGHRDLEQCGLNVSNIFAAPFGGYSTIDSHTLDILEGEGYSGLLLTNGSEKVKLSKLGRPTKLMVANRYLPSNR